MNKQRGNRLLVAALLLGLTLGVLFTLAPLMAQTEPIGGIDKPTSFEGLRKAGTAGLSPFLTVTQPGDYVAAGIGLRGRGSGQISISDIPNGASVTHAFLYWVIVDSAQVDEFSEGTFDGVAILGTLIGTDLDPCWDFTGASQSFAFRADVTSLVSGNGDFQLDGFASGPPMPVSNFDEALTLPLAEGASLVVLYQDPAAAENRSIVLYEGGATIRGAVTSTTTSLVIPPVATGGTARTTFIVADGQDHGTDDTIFNGVTLAEDRADNAASFDASDGLLWDTDTYDVTDLVNAGEESVTATLSKGSDCLVHVAQVFSASSTQPLEELVCELEILSPESGVLICPDSVEVRFVTRVSGGRPPITGSDCEVNGIAASAVNDSVFSAVIPLAPGTNNVSASCTFTDQAGEQTSCEASILVRRAPLPSCEITIDSHADSMVVCADSLDVSGFFGITGGANSLLLVGEVNGIAATLGDSTFSARIPLQFGDNIIVATLTVTDSCGNVSVCADTITVLGPPEPDCMVEIISPQDSSFVCGDSLVVRGVTTVEGGLGPFTFECSVNGVPATVDANGQFIVTVATEQALSEGLTATCIVTDSCGSKVICFDTITVQPAQPPICEVEITSPLDSVAFCGDSLTVRGVTTIAGGLPPFSIICDINGIPVAADSEGNFEATIPLDFGVENTVIATCVVVDSCGAETVCADTILVQPPPEPVCVLEIISPQDSSTFCGDSLQVTGRTVIEAGSPPFEIACSVNGIPAVTDAEGNFMATIPAQPGENLIVAMCVVTDSCGLQAICVDSVRTVAPAAPSCIVAIQEPNDRDTFCGDSLLVRGTTIIEGGLAPFALSCDVNGVETTVDSEGNFETTIPLEFGVENTVIATCIVVDSCGIETVCADTILVQPPPEPVCVVQIISPQDSSAFCGDSLKVTGRTIIESGLPAFEIVCNVNGIPAVSDAEGNFMATIPLEAGANTIVAACVVTDSCGAKAICADTVVVVPPPPPVCKVEITSPQDGTAVCGDSVRVIGVTSIEGGLPPLAVQCTVNDQPAILGPDGTFMATVALLADENFIVATCVVTDSCGAQTVCSDTVNVVGPVPPTCDISFPSLHDSAIVCTEELLVEAVANISGGLPPFEVTCEINGVAAERANNAFTANVTLDSGENLILATCSIRDSCGVTTICSDSAKVFVDDTPPDCVFGTDGLAVLGTFTDDLSGIAQLEIRRLRNGILTVDPDPFVGSQTVNFRIDPIDPNQSMGFVIDVADSCGNVFRCDPVFLGLDTNRPERQFSFTFPSIDRYFQINNRGLSEIRVELNGKRFAFYSNASRAAAEINAFHLLADGIVTIDLEKHLQDGDNTMVVEFEGAAGSRASLLLVDIAPPQVDFVLELESLPTEFALEQNYPNPFNPTTNIRFGLPPEVQNTVVQLQVFNLIGELVRVLIDEQAVPGDYQVEWDGRDQKGRAVSSGIYIYRLVAGEFRQTRRMLLLK